MISKLLNAIEWDINVDFDVALYNFVDADDSLELDDIVELVNAAAIEYW